MQSITLIHQNLINSRERTLANIQDMENLCLVPSTVGGPHTLWILGHLAYIESMIRHRFILGEINPLAEWEALFDGAEFPTSDAGLLPFDEVLTRCRGEREATLVLLDSLKEEDLDHPGAGSPAGWEATFGTTRQCLQYGADHWYMHRGHLADARRAAGVDRMWV